MRIAFRLFVLGAVVVFTAGGLTGMSQGRTTDPARKPTEWEKKGWRLTFRDEFGGVGLDRAKWNDCYWHGRTHGNELQYYAPDGLEVSGGVLRLKAEKRRYEGHEYTSGMITSLGKFEQRYGLFEIRAKFPKGKGYWPAFWLLPTSRRWPPEIDVLEILGHEPNKVYMTVHWRDEQGKHVFHSMNWVGPDFSADFHTFAVEWKPEEIIWYVDGVERARTDKGVPHQPMYLIANLAVGGSWPGSPDESTRFPGFMEIDYIRAYARPTQAQGK